MNSERIANALCWLWVALCWLASALAGALAGYGVDVLLEHWQPVGYGVGCLVAFLCLWALDRTTRHAFEWWDNLPDE